MVTSAAEVTNISKHGFWLLVSDQEFFLPFEEFPWFEAAPIGAVLNVELQHEGHLHWPDLDVDLTVDSVRDTKRYPLKARS
jgi:hypothetical protein